VGASRRGRFPSLRELYSGSLNRFEPNPALTAEHLFALEGGATLRVGGAEFQAVAFHQRLSDAIVRITTPQGLFRRVNRDQLRSTGLELLASRAFGDVSVGGDLTLQSVKLIDPAANETREPENQPAVYGSLNVRLPLILDVQAGSELRYTGSQFCLDLDTGEDTRLAGGAHVSADVSRAWQFRSTGSPWFSRLEARIAADNIGDTAIYDQCGLPQPGRLLRFEVRLF
jgi:iron complex outermembrane receptor protein